MTMAVLAPNLNTNRRAVSVSFPDSRSNQMMRNFPLVCLLLVFTKTTLAGHVQKFSSPQMIKLTRKCMVQKHSKGDSTRSWTHFCTTDVVQPQPKHITRCSRCSVCRDRVNSAPSCHGVGWRTVSTMQSGARALHPPSTRSGDILTPLSPIQYRILTDTDSQSPPPYLLLYLHRAKP